MEFTDEELQHLRALIKPDARGFYRIKDAELMHRIDAILRERSLKNVAVITGNHCGVATMRQALSARDNFRENFPHISQWRKGVNARIDAGLLYPVMELDYASVEKRILAQMQQHNTAVNNTFTVHDLYRAAIPEKAPENPYPVYAKKDHPPSALLRGLVGKLKK